MHRSIGASHVRALIGGARRLRVRFVLCFAALWGGEAAWVRCDAGRLDGRSTQSGHGDRNVGLVA